MPTNMHELLFLSLLLIGSPLPAFSTPAMLPRHPGYPAAGEFANDAGRPPSTVEQSLKDAAAQEDARVMQKLIGSNNARIIHSQGGGRLPIVELPPIEIESIVKETGQKGRSQA